MRDATCVRKSVMCCANSALVVNRVQEHKPESRSTATVRRQDIKHTDRAGLQNQMRERGHMTFMPALFPGTESDETVIRFRYIRTVNFPSYRGRVFAFEFLRTSLTWRSSGSYLPWQCRASRKTRAITE